MHTFFGYVPRYVKNCAIGNVLHLEQSERERERDREREREIERER